MLFPRWEYGLGYCTSRYKLNKTGNDAVQLSRKKHSLESYSMTVILVPRVRLDIARDEEQSFAPFLSPEFIHILNCEASR